MNNSSGTRQSPMHDKKGQKAIKRKQKAVARQSQDKQIYKTRQHKTTQHNTRKTRQDKIR